MLWKTGSYKETEELVHSEWVEDKNQREADDTQFQKIYNKILQSTVVKV